MGPVPRRSWGSRSRLLQQPHLHLSPGGLRQEPKRSEVGAREVSRRAGFPPPAQHGGAGGRGGVRLLRPGGDHGIPTSSYLMIFMRSIVKIVIILCDKNSRDSM